MNRKILTLLLLVFIVNCVARAQTYDERARAYIRQYAQYAIQDQRQTGVPASITLSQGLLETEAGSSELMVNANNHFGIKCKNNWQGPTYLHTDDAKDECFKKYSCALESYNDHSAHLLRNPRYKVLFTYSPTDYAKWAHGIKKCGYATNPRYAYELIKLIEDYKLQEYTYAALDSNYQLPQMDDEPVGIAQAQPATPVTETKEEYKAPEHTGFEAIAQAADSARAAISKNQQYSAQEETPEAPVNDGKIETVNGLRAIYVHRGEALLQYAIRYKVRYAHLLEMNDMPDEPMLFDGYVYLEKKHATAPTNAMHNVRNGETLLMIAQSEGIQLKKLAALNKMLPTEDPVAGVVLHLQLPAAEKPAVQSGIRVYSEPAYVANDQPVIDDSTDYLYEPAKKEQQSEKEVGFGMGFQAPAAQPAPVPAKAAPKKSSFWKDDPGPPENVEQSKTTGKVTYYVVKKGETAYSIAKRNGIPLEDLQAWNHIKPGALKAGQRIIIGK